MGGLGDWGEGPATPPREYTSFCRQMSTLETKVFCSESPGVGMIRSEADSSKTGERASQEEQNGANFSFIAPSSEEL